MSCNLIQLLNNANASPFKNYREPTLAQLQYLLHFNGEQGSTAMVEENGRNFVPQSGAVLSQEFSKFGGSSLRVGAGAFTSRAWTTAEKIGGGDFTIEMWVRADNLVNVVNGLWRCSTSVSSSNGLSLYILADGSVAIYRTGTAPYIVSPAGVVQVGQWHHIALTRETVSTRTAFKIWVDGIEQGNFGSVLQVTEPDFVIGHAYGRRVGSSSNYGGTLNGYIDEFRYTKGIALYYENFIPQKEPFVLPTA